MTAYDRIMCAVSRQPVDRIPTDMWCTNEVVDQLKRYFRTSDVSEVWRKLEVDRIEWYPSFMDQVPVCDEYVGPKRDTHENVFGVTYKKQKVADGKGTYLEFDDQPLRDRDEIKTVKNEYAWPSADWFDFKETRKRIESLRRKGWAVLAGCAAPFTMYTQIRGFEQALMDLAANEEYAHYVLSRIFAFEYSFLERLYEAAGDLIDFSFLAEDIGSQTGPMFSKETFDKYLASFYTSYIDLMKSHGIKVFFHSDGGIRPFISALIDLGIDVLNPVQWKCTGMDRKELKARYGDRVCFHGGVDNQEVLFFGKEKDVQREVSRCLETLGSDGTGYILAPCHNIQPNTPIKNVIALYHAAHCDGRY
jgi:uroporphyrinogen decarboxylase